MITNVLWAIFMLNNLTMLSIFGGDSIFAVEYKVAFAPGEYIHACTDIGQFIYPYFTKSENDQHGLRKI